MSNEPPPRAPDSSEFVNEPKPAPESEQVEIGDWLEQQARRDADLDHVDPRTPLAPVPLPTRPDEHE